MQQKNFHRETVCFFMGYANLFNHETNSISKNIYGSELALYHLAMEFSKTFEVFITSLNFYENADFGPLHYIHYRELVTKTTFNYMIVWRYLNYFIHIPYFVAKQTYLWLHDTIGLPWWETHTLPDDGRSLFLNIASKLDKIIVLCDWHKKEIIKAYNIQDPVVLDKLTVIGNAIPRSHICLIHEEISCVKRTQNRFIWVSSYVRGLDQLIKYFQRIKSLLPNAELLIFRDESTSSVSYDNKYIKFLGFLPNEQLIKEMMKADFWFYPTNFDETFCISALEAQASGCICIASDKAALHETIYDRGILLRESIYSDEYWAEATSAILRLTNEKQKEHYREKGQYWAFQQTWDRKADMWRFLFTSQERS